MKVCYVPWVLRGYPGMAWQVYVEITGSRDISDLIEVKRRLNNPPVCGMVLAENRSKALKRLGWKELDDGLWYKIFP